MKQTNKQIKHLVDIVWYRTENIEPECNHLPCENKKSITAAIATTSTVATITTTTSSSNSSSSTIIVTRYVLDGPGFESRW
jgi:hypothetical protein